MWCFGGNWTHPPKESTSDIFKHAAFDATRCGDCVIASLLGKSSRGLEAFLPPQARPASADANTNAPPPSFDSPILPLTRDWHDADFALSKVVPADWSARDFATNLLLRYSYVMGGQKARLIMLHNEFQGRWQLGRVKPQGSFLGLGNLFAPKNPSFVGINDDIEQDEEEIDSMLHGWFNMHWPEPLTWET